MREQQLKKSFQNPPPGYGIVPFYWWLGDPVTKEKLLYHLEQLEGYSISGLQINYAHSDRGGHSWGLTYPGEPAVFSEEWWNMVGFFLQEAKKRGIAVSLSDYTLGSPGQGYYADEILQENPEACGHLLMCERMWVLMRQDCLRRRRNCFLTSMKNTCRRICIWKKMIMRPLPQSRLLCRSISKCPWHSLSPVSLI